VRLLALSVAFLAVLCAPAQAADVVFVQTNAADGRNAVRALVATSDGDLRSAGTFRTGQSGTGRRVESQGTLATTQDGRHLAVLDVRSSTVTVFRVGNGRLRVTDRLGSGGRRPVSIASAGGNRFLVLNAGGKPGLAGFDLVDGTLVPVAGLNATLSQSGASPYQVSISPNGGVVAVSYEDGTEGRDVELFELSGDRLETRSLAAVQGGGPSPLTFVDESALLVGRMGPGDPGLGTYSVGSGLGSLTPLSLSSGGALPCWVQISASRTRGWATSPAAVQTFAIGAGAKLEILRSRALTGRTSDVTIGEGDRRLYVLNERRGRVRVLALHPRNLSVLGSSGLLPKTTTGIVDLPNNIGGF
jgi:hypothetical protein